MPNSVPLASLRSMSKDFVRPNGKQFTVLESIHLDIMDGEFLAIVGISGSGKTTLLRCLAGIMQPDRGSVSFAHVPEHHGQLLSFVFQTFALFPWLTVRENVEIGLPNMPKSARDAEVDKILELLGLEGFEDCLPKELSGGTKQRVSLCRAMVGKPMLLLMDEPFSSLDALTGESLRSELGRLWMQPNRNIRSAVLVTHNLSEALQLADRVIILSANPGTIHKIIDVKLERPRMQHSPAYLKLEAELERVFGELHLNRITMQGSIAGQSVAQTSGNPDQRVRPLINASLVLVEGLVGKLWDEANSLDLYDLCDDMGQSVDEMLHAIASAETIQFLTTPGTKMVLTKQGKIFAAEQNPLKRRELLREACARLPLISAVIRLIADAGPDGLPKAKVMQEIVTLLPFEDPDIQFDSLLKWSRHVDLLSYEPATGMLQVES